MISRTAACLALLLVLPLMTKAQEAHPRSIPEIARAARGAVVSIVMSDKKGEPIAQGSGFIVSRDGLILTNYHVIAEGSSALVKLPDGAFYPVQGVVAADKSHDIAVIKVHGEGFRTLTLGNSDRVQVGQEVVAIGNPLSLESSVSNGIVSGIRSGQELGGRFLQVTTPISPGSSGGPLFNMEGEVVGITTMYLKGGENLNFAIPINQARRLLLDEHGKAQPLPDEPRQPEEEAGGAGSGGPLCAFVTARMLRAIPQVPTSCKQTAAAQADVYSPTNVLEGGLRRAWSTALFQTFQDSVSNGPCGEEGGCRIAFSDSKMSQDDVHYVPSFDKRLVGILQMGGGDSFSDGWYTTWWTSMVGVVSGSPGSEVNAAQIAGMACREYVQAAGDAGFSPVPECSVLLNTSEEVDIVLDFQNVLYAMSTNNAESLLNTFGMTFDLTGYRGDVIVRSPWNQGSRIYTIYPLRSLEFYWEEIQSGLRDEAAATLDVIQSGMQGQREEHVFSRDPSGNDVVIRSAAVARDVPSAGGGESLVDLTDGSEWLAPSDAIDRCGLAVGSDITVIAVGSNKPALSLNGRKSCDLKAKFVGGW